MSWISLLMAFAPPSMLPIDWGTWHCVLDDGHGEITFAAQSSNEPIIGAINARSEISESTNSVFEVGYYEGALDYRFPEQQAMQFWKDREGDPMWSDWFEIVLPEPNAETALIKLGSQFIEPPPHGLIANVDQASGKCELVQ